MWQWSWFDQRWYNHISLTIGCKVIYIPLNCKSIVALPTIIVVEREHVHKKNIQLWEEVYL